MGDGTVHTGDVVVRGDGEGGLVGKLVGGDETKGMQNLMGVFRWKVPGEVLRRDEEVEGFMKGRERVVSCFVGERSALSWVQSPDGEVHDLELVCSIDQPDGTERALVQEDLKKSLREASAPFHPVLRRALEECTKSTNWSFSYAQPGTKMVRDRVVLLGGTSHAINPTCQALEDAAALGVLLSRLSSKDEVRSRLKLFESLRAERVAAMQRALLMPFGRENELPKGTTEYLSAGKKFASSEEFMDYFYSYDVIAESKRILQKSQQAWSRL